MRGILKQRRTKVTSPIHGTEATISAIRVGEGTYHVSKTQLLRVAGRLCPRLDCECGGEIAWGDEWTLVDRIDPRTFVFEAQEFKLVNHNDGYQGAKRFKTFAHAKSDLGVARTELFIFGMSELVDLRIVDARAVWDGKKWGDSVKSRPKDKNGINRQ